MEMRFTPALRKPRKRAASTVPGLASRVISAWGSSASRARTPERSASMDSGENRLGVPPPMKTLMTRRPQTDGNAASTSSINRLVYSDSGKAPERSCELKSQYGHLRTHHGIWTYSASGGSASKRTAPGRSTATGIMQQLQQASERLSAVADPVLLRGLELGRGLAVVL